MDPARLRALDIVPVYEDAGGQPSHVDEGTVRHLLHAMDLPEDAAAVPSTDDVLVVSPGRPRRTPDGELELEDGRSRPVRGQLPGDLPSGYHTLHRQGGGSTSVIVSPGRCVPHRGRPWGFAVQLYSLLSAASWGVGDLADLRAFGRWSAQRGAGLALINPLDAAIPRRPREASPYFPSSRRYRDVLYLRLEDVPGVEAVEGLDELATRARGSAGRIDRDAVTDAKLEALTRIWHRAPEAGHEPGFLRYRDQQGESLRAFATFVALAEEHGGGFHAWPSELRHPEAPAVREAADRLADRIDFHAWVQWTLDEQLGAAADEIPLMRDLPIGFAPDGADAWAWQDVLAHDVTIGAPPDALGPEGQDWMMPPFVPWKLRAAHYRPFVETIRSSMRHAGSLRIDHVLGLFRLFWIPPGGAAHGAYVRQYTDDLLDIVALESHRAGAYVVGEDLGTVEDGVRDRLVERRMLRYRVLWFEEDPPHRWEPTGLGSVSTHDLPTVAGAWTRSDQAEYERIGLHLDPERFDAMRDRLAERTGLGPGADTSEACVAAAGTLAEAGTDVVVAQLEDAVGATHRINVPGTTDERRPENWSIPLPVALEELAEHPTVTRVVAALRDRPPGD